MPVIYMTGNDDPAVRRAAVASGCIAFLTKPFSTQSLIEPLKKASGGPLRTAGAVNIPLTDWEDYRSRPWRDTVLQEEPSPFPKLR